MAQESRTFTGVDRAHVDRLRESIAPYVRLPESDSGTIESQGIKGRYAYNEAAQTLTLTLDEVPFYIPQAMIWSTIERALG
jgi:hypothetical protein